MMETELPTQKQMLQMVQRKIEPQTTIPNQTQQPLDTIHSTVQPMNGKLSRGHHHPNSQAIIKT